jgi:tRNA U34 5-methylaminomethyl-2-thiouridine-forming methyltransferase MnmC
MAAFFSGEFLLDLAREDSGVDPRAFDDAYFRKTQSGTNIRSQVDESGKLKEQTTKKNTDSYEYNNYKGLRDSNHEAYHKRKDLMEYVVKESPPTVTDGKISEEERRD